MKKICHLAGWKKVYLNFIMPVLMRHKIRQPLFTRKTVLVYFTHGIVKLLENLGIHYIYS